MDKILTIFIPSVLATFVLGLFGWAAAMFLPLTYSGAAYGFYKSYAELYFDRGFVPLSGNVPSKSELVKNGLGFGALCIIVSFLCGVMVRNIFFASSNRPKLSKFPIFLTSAQSPKLAPSKTPAGSAGRALGDESSEA